MKLKSNVRQFFEEKRPSASFVSVWGYRSSKGELSNVQLILNIDYSRVLRESLEVLSTINLVKTDEGEFHSGDELFDTAKAELADSFEKSLAGENEKSDWMDEAFEKVSKNVKIHKESGTVHVSGKKFGKEVLEKGEYKEVKSRTKTKIKNAMRNQLPVSEWRQYKLKDNFQYLGIEGEKLAFDDLYE